MKEPNPIFKGLSTEQREKVWFDLYCKYQTYAGSMQEFIKEHNIGSSAFYRWSKKFQTKANTIVPNDSTKSNKLPELTGISAIDQSIQAEIDRLPDSQAENNELDYIAENIDKFSGEENNAILAAIELFLPQGYKIRLANHADVSLAIRLVKGIITDE